MSYLGFIATRHSGYVQILNKNEEMKELTKKESKIIDGGFFWSNGAFCIWASNAVL